MGCLFTHAQTNSHSRLTELQLPFRNRDTYISQAERYLRNYYEQLLLNVQNGMVQESFIRNHMSADQKRYMPEFLLRPLGIGQYIQPDQYLLEQDKQFTAFNLDNLQLKVDKIIINNDDFFMSSLVSCYIIAEYDLTLEDNGRTLYKRRCKAYCLFPNISAYIDVRLLQVEPLYDIEPYDSQADNTPPDNYKDNLELIVNKAEQGYAEAQNVLGDFYLLGIGLETRPDIAYQLYKSAAEKGHKDALSNLAYCLELGLGVNKDVILALKLYEEAANKGSVWAVKRLGDIYFDGKIVTGNIDTAADWYSIAANSGDKTAKSNVMELMKPKCRDLHRVLRKESVYSISRLYGIQEHELIKANPEIKDRKLKRGKLLCIPNAVEYKITRTDKCLYDKDIKELIKKVNAL